MNPKLIIIRGPSGSGKSTVANKLFKQSVRPTLLVSEDTIRKMFNDHKKTGHLTSRQLAIQAVLTGLQNGYDVIYHGILRINNDNGHRFDELLEVHPDENYLFYLDVSLDETIRRHGMRSKQHEFDAESMKKWWDFSSPTNFDSETIIAESSSVDDTVSIINKVTGFKNEPPIL